MMKRTPFPGVFWVANTIEILERFAYYGIYFGFAIYMQSLGYSTGQMGFVQSIFLFISYMIPVISGTFADRYGFKKILIISYLAYLPSILLLIFTKSFSGIALTMLSIGLAAGIFKPLVAGTVRATTDKTNKTLGFGIFYAMVNVGGSFGPIVAGKLRAISWNYAFLAAAISAALMLLITIFFYKEPEREIEGITLKKKFKEIYTVLSDYKFSAFLVLLGLGFWLPLWSFFNILAIYVDRSLDTAKLYLDLKSVFGTGFASIVSALDKTDLMRVWAEGIARTGLISPESWSNVKRVILGESISHTGYIIMILQVFVSRFFERFKAIPAFLSGMVVAALGFSILGYAKIGAPAWVFFGIFLFALGEMISAPRIQEYITWIAPKEKAGLYMGTNFLALGIGGLTSGLYTALYGHFRTIGHPENIWFVLAGNFILGMFAILIFIKKAGEFKEVEA